ncbi:MAG TPA: tRNA 5-methoxyuridine(34)/uridine 5-oxyacetic acid(34) synthase CmoB, partial [Oceanospirillaceae bacterium]|nr:tRNA 5-methoxyuridine(34)/uridine 5-oxyacetic acid(34) synthase CmoB [Oceanospirillaceae bacterium]
LNAMPQLSDPQYSFTSNSVTVNKPTSLTIDTQAYTEQLKAFMPWRKGPWNLLGVDIDTEWHSDWKWQRIAPHISPLAGRKVLDIGTGNG